MSISDQTIFHNKSMANSTVSLYPKKGELVLSHAQSNEAVWSFSILTSEDSDIRSQQLSCFETLKSLRGKSPYH